VARWPFRVGRGGGAPARPGEGEEGDGTGEWSPFSRPVVRRGSGGGSFSVTARTGRGGMTGLFSAETPPAAALFASPVTGRTGGGGGGGRLPAADGGAWKFFCWLRAAMRSASVVNRGSSSSCAISSGVWGTRAVNSGLGEIPGIQGCCGAAEDRKVRKPARRPGVAIGPAAAKQDGARLKRGVGGREVPAMYPYHRTAVMCCRDQSQALNV